jgi:hypothetical protein
MIAAQWHSSESATLELRHDRGMWIALLLPLTGILPSIGSGVIDAADSIFHVHRIYALRLLLDQGEIYPRWVSYFHLGYGYPIFNFYAPGSYYAGALLTYLGFDAPAAYNMVSAFAWMLGSLGCYLLARRFLPTYSALLAALLWAYAPSRLFEVWEQGSLPQSLATACLPWLLMGMHDAAKRPSLHALLGISLPFAAILFTHQPTAVIAMLTAAVYGTVLVLDKLHNRWRTAVHITWLLGGGLALGVGITAIFVIPAFLELRFIDAARGTADMFDVLRSGFLHPEQLFVQQGVFDLTDLRRDLPKTFGLVPGLLAAVGIVALSLQRRYKLALLLASAVALFAFMLLSISFGAWDIVPLLAQLRFPERFLRIGVVPLALLGGAALLLVSERWRGAGLIAVGGLVLIAAMPSLIPTERFLTWDSLSAVDEIRTEMNEYIWGSTSYNEFNPVWGESIALDAPDNLARYRDAPLHVNIQRFDCPGSSYESLGDTTYRFHMTEDCQVDFRQYYYPGWVVTLDNETVDAEPEPDLGLIRVPLPPGEYDVALHYGGTATQLAGALITGLSLVVVVALKWFLQTSWMPRLATEFSAVSKSEQEASARPPTPVGTHNRSFVPLTAGDAQLPLRWQAVMFGAVTCVGLAVFVSAYLIPQTTWFRQVSPPDAPATMTTEVNAEFGELFRLLGYRLDGAANTPASEFGVELFWRAEQVITENYRPIVQLVDPDVTRAYAVSQPFRPAAGHTVGWTPEYFASDPHRLRLFEDADMVSARLSIQMVQSDTGAALLLPDGRDRLVLDVEFILDS